MSVTAHRATQTFHVDYNLDIEGRPMKAVLETESLLDLETESLLPLEIELYDGAVHILRAHKVGHNTFVAKVGSI